MDVAELQAVLADEDLRDTVQLVDVREAWEEQEARLPGFTLLPLSRQEEWVPIIAQQLDPQQHTIVLCHHGVRSQMVASLLATRMGFQEVSNVSGGIDAYARLDPKTPRY